MRTVLGVVVLALLVGVGASGCVAVAAGAAGAAGYAYIAGNSEGLVEAPAERVEQSAVAVFREMDVELKETKRDEKGGKTTLLGKGPKEPVKVTIQKEGEATRVFVRVGATGDEQYSKTVFERIVARL